jgi:hypothetical protein
MKKHYSVAEYINTFKQLNCEPAFYLTPEALFAVGMCKCSECGHINSVDNKQCIRCNESFVIFRQ